MPKRFEQYYRTKRLDNLGDPDWHDRRWQDIDLRMANRELDSTRIDDAVDRMEAVALARLNETFRPIIEQAHALLADVGISFNGQSLTEETVGVGTKTFIITEQYRVPLSTCRKSHDEGATDRPLHPAVSLGWFVRSV